MDEAVGNGCLTDSSLMPGNLEQGFTQRELYFIWKGHCNHGYGRHDLASGGLIQPQTAPVQENPHSRQASLGEHEKTPLTFQSPPFLLWKLSEAVLSHVQKRKATLRMTQLVSVR